MAKISISQILLLVLAFVFILQITIPDLTTNYLFSPAHALSQPWLFITSIFLHQSVEHLLFNCLALFFFGTLLESFISHNEYLFVFFASGIVGGLFYYATYLIGIIPSVPALGASGAIYGLLGALAMILPDLKINLLFLFPIKLRDFVLLWIIFEFIGTFDISSGVASAAHLGGLFFGLLCGWYFKKRLEGYVVSSNPDPWHSG